MDKKLLAFLCIVSIALISGIVIMFFYYDPDNFVFPEGSTYRGVTPFQTENAVSIAEHWPQNDSSIKLIGGICALLLLGYLLVICYQKYMMDSKSDSVASKNSLHRISIESGRTEYELFVIAAKEWSITEAQIDEDFKNYMAANVLPYYVMDLVRKNSDRVNESLIKQEEVEPTSRRDFLITLIIFTVVLLLLPLLGIIFGHNVLK